LAKVTGDVDATATVVEHVVSGMTTDVGAALVNVI
jgi:hypothetical protein